MQRESLIACPPLFPSVAEEAWGICSEFRLTDVTGQPLLGEASLPWLRDFVMAVFGAEDPETGRRHINEFMLMVSKKNAKSTIAAAIMLCALLMNWRQSAELLILRPDMPRSLHASLNEVLANLQLVSAHPDSETLRHAGKLRAELAYGRIDEILATGLHAFLTQFLERINALGGRISREFLLPQPA